MKRAIVQLFWGEKFVDEVLNTTAASYKQSDVDRIAITDHSTASMIPERSPFDKVITVENLSHSLLAKAGLYQHLPEDYDSFVFLDTDTTLLEDISFGFQKAESYGIAAVMVT